jgi:hypothetical protein
MSLERRPLCSITDLLAASQDEVARPPGLYKSIPSQAGGEGLSHLLALNLVRLEADALFQCLESRVLSSSSSSSFYGVLARFGPLPWPLPLPSSHPRPLHSSLPSVAASHEASRLQSEAAGLDHRSR